MSQSPSAQLIGNSFVHAYYTTLTQKPQDLYKFYKDTSTFTHDSTESVGLKEIKSRIDAYEFNNCKAVLSAVDSQKSLSGTLLVLVIGFLSNNGEEYQRFSQSFVLAEQPNGYYVHNDIFRFIEDEKVDAEEQTEEEGLEQENTEEIQTTETQPEVAEEKVEQQEERPVVEAEQPEADVQPQPAAPAPTPAKAEVSTQAQPRRSKGRREQQQKQEQQEQQVTAPSAPKTYASALVSGAAAPAPAAEKPARSSRPKQPKAAASTNEQHSVANGASATTAPASAVRTQAAKPAKPVPSKEGHRHTIFVSKLPANTSSQDLREVFATFGKIVDIALNERGFAFVEFDSAAAVVEAVKASFSLRMGDNIISIEEKKKSGGRMAGRRYGGGHDSRASSDRFNAAATSPTSPSATSPTTTGDSSFKPRRGGRAAAGSSAPRMHNKPASTPAAAQ